MSQNVYQRPAVHWLMLSAYAWAVVDVVRPAIHWLMFCASALAVVDPVRPAINWLMFCASAWAVVDAVRWADGAKPAPHGGPSGPGVVHSSIRVRHACGIV